MKTILTLVGLALSSPAVAQHVATFEDLGIAVDQYWDGSDQSAMFTSGDYTFVNNYVDWGGYGSWDGFAYSSMTATSYVTMDDQYNACVGHGAGGSQTYAVVYYSSYMGTEPTVILQDAMPFTAHGCYVTNSAYAYTSMTQGDAYAKKFDDTDWFMITATGYLNNVAGQSATFYLAKEGVIVNDWQYFDLSALGEVDEIHFTLSSSDTGEWGMNTPAYFCMDNFGATDTSTRLNALGTNRQDAVNYRLNGQKTESGSKGLMIQNGRVILAK